AEGMGLTTLEGMACGVPQHLPSHSALADWAATAAHMVPCTSIAANTRRINTIGQVPDTAASIAGFQELYSDRVYRESLRSKGLELVSESRFRWDNIGASFAAAIEGV